MRLGAGPLLRTLPIWLLLAGLGCRSSAAKGEPGELLRTGKRLYAKKNYAEAARQFRGVERDHLESDEAEEALFLLAESDRHLHEGQTAFGEYKKFADKYPRSRFAVGAAVGEFRLGIDHFEGRIPGFLFFGPDRKLGVEILEHMQLHYHNHSLADEALMRVADFQLKEKDYEAASDTLRRLLAEYPRSKHVLWARYQLARTLWLRNQGADYDERLLRRSRRAYEDFIGTAKLMGQGKRLAKRIDQAGKMIARIDERLAEKDYRIGRFYERTGHPRSALYYYDRCVANFPGTRHAAACRGRLKRLRPAGPRKAS